ncbi:LysR family transcriptional regulator [Endozoicomonas ascidiicola]|uniref:LysR family transcriptional regulator n=1 Tax=Endozoicomonas ascidiicola TaxID=1698521 RepID=UPI000835373D|nr:LysR family transcriptional regulator [Endozoicomonas ascidiicola]
MSIQNLGLELRHLKTLKAIQQTGSLVEASSRLHLTQSALSHQLKDLEHRIGMEVFVRKTRPPRFTTAGLKLLELADEVLPMFKAVEQNLLKLAGGKSGRLHIAIECHSCYQWLMPTIDEYRKHWPEVEMDFSTAFNFAPLPALSRGELDLVVTSDPTPIDGIDYLPLFRYEMLLALARNHPLAGQAFANPEDLNNEVLITYPVEQERLAVFYDFLDPAQVEPASIRTAELTLMMLQLVASQRGVSALPCWALAEYLDKGQVHALPLGEKGVWSTLYAAVRTEQKEQPYMDSFINSARETCFTTLNGIKPA